MIFDTISPLWLVMGAFACAALAPWLARLFGRASGAILAIFPLAAFILLLAGGSPIWSGEVWRGTLRWAPQLGIDWDLWISPVGLLLALLVTGLGTLIVGYAGAYLDDSASRGRFFATLLAFMGAMLGLAMTENLVVAFVFWELTSVTSYLLIGHYCEREESRKSALDALLVTGGGGVVLLAGILLLGEAGGTYRLGELIDNRETVITSRLYPAIFLCVFVGAATKSAQVPFHFWLPGAMAAPAPVSAYLHSATMVKAGVFLLAIMHPLLGGTPWWHFSLLITGAVTMAWGAVVAVAQTDLKRLLAFSTVSALGTLVMLLGIESELAAKAAMVFLLVHALYKGSLFMVAGILEKASGTRDVDDLRGLMRTMPVLAAAAAMAAASMSGMPPFVGFIAKELLYEVKLQSPFVGWPLLAIGFAANVANIVVALKVGVAPFLGRKSPAVRRAVATSWVLAVGPVALAAGSLACGVFAQPLLGGVLNSSVNQIRAVPVDFELKLWHGFSPVLLLSALTLISGVGVYCLRTWLRRPRAWLATRLGWSARDVFRRGWAGFLAAAGRLTRLIQSGNLYWYLLATFGAGIALMAWGFVRWGGDRIHLAAVAGFRVDVAVVAVVVIVSTVGLLRSRGRMACLLFLGCVGFGIAALFALYGAPDLAITQLLVETLTLVIMALVLRGLPGIGVRRSTGPSTSVAAWIVPGAMGAGFSALTLLAFASDSGEPVGRLLADRSVPEGFGRNVVNVILVDFRALDTLGELAVLVIAALGVSAMAGGTTGGKAAPLIAPAQTSAVLGASARFTAPALLFFSFYLLLRGHNEPGGGFIGGLVGAMAAILSRLAEPDRKPARHRLSPTSLMALGLAIAALSGLPGLIVEGSFLAAAWGPEMTLPILGKLKLGTPLAFDIGVYLAVAGVVLSLFRDLSALGSAGCPRRSPADA